MTGNRKTTVAMRKRPGLSPHGNRSRSEASEFPPFFVGETIALRINLCG
jgi:hypothetical protein